MTSPNGGPGSPLTRTKDEAGKLTKTNSGSPTVDMEAAPIEVSKTGLLNNVRPEIYLKQNE